MSQPIRVGIVGTGFAAKLRAETFNADDRTELIGVAGHTPEKTSDFGNTHQTQVFPAWQDLVGCDRVDLVVISTLNAHHGAIARAALDAHKHVVVEYPLSLHAPEGEALLALARQQNRLLHVEHIELLGGVHQAFIQALPQVGTPFYARYSTVTPQHPAPRKWTYHTQLFGFPLAGALSRLHRLIHGFGAVETVSCQHRYWHESESFYTGCMSKAQLQFKSGLLADVVYAKGETVWTAERKLEVQGDRGSLVFDGDAGRLVNAEGDCAIAVGSRRGLFAQDTAAVIDHLVTGAPLYVTPAQSVYTLKVANAAQRSTSTGRAEPVDP
ncbi:Gfo/Idh/MocA family protein [Myxacorys almedinensis]|uniref:Gfo/Idh/MocA family oxidoreductase n=1 Tax=Myxacorys almedinensis A TaxID=2690445 RepID=A0A8J7YW48_9CYAN|nr:Gfo/Idh/MocA family oxidoreductase [Myxacorys almedinensis]NDJ15712.1 Gfo/Idh/MocA family oxidoreductase [Myxacorys almedinensis A]